MIAKEFIQSAMEQSSTGIAIADAPFGHLQYINEAGLKILGDPDEKELSGIKAEAYTEAWDIRDLDGTPLPLKEIPLAKAVLFGESSSKEIIIRTHSGFDKYVLANASPIYDGNGIRTGGITIFYDISEIRKTRDELQTRETNFRTLFNDMIQGVVYQDRNGAIILANKAATVLLGLTMDQLTGRTSVDKSWHAITEDGLPFPGENHPAMVSLRTGEKVSACIMGVFNPQKNDYVWISINSVPMFRENESAPYQVFTTFEDITLRKTAEKKLREKTEDMEQFFGLAVDLLTIVNTNGYFVHLSKSWERVLGYTIEELKSAKIHSFIHPDDQRITDEAVSVLHEQKPLTNFVNRYRHKNGTYRTLEWRSEQMGNLIYAAARDISDRITYEQEIQNRNEMLTNLNAEKDKLFSIIAHDLRSPFHGFLGLTKIMAAEKETLSIEEYIQYSKVLRNTAENMYILLDTLLEWSRMQRGLIPYDPVPLRVCDAAAAAIDQVKDSANKKNITIEAKRIFETEQLKIFADKHMTIMILRNLLSNAVKYTRRGGNVHVDAAIKNDRVEISITDTGVGISAEALDGLFKISGKISTLGTEGEPSTGLGLLLVKEFVERQEGSIRVESTVGKGSAFIVSLPNGPLENSQVLPE